jgi:hypothetical protein
MCLVMLLSFRQSVGSVCNIPCLCWTQAILIFLKFSSFSNPTFIELTLKLACLHMLASVHMVICYCVLLALSRVDV